MRLVPFAGTQIGSSSQLTVKAPTSPHEVCTGREEAVPLLDIAVRSEGVKLVYVS